MKRKDGQAKYTLIKATVTRTYTTPEQQATTTTHKYRLIQEK